jgi:hypothetical protein
MKVNSTATSPQRYRVRSRVRRVARSSPAFNPGFAPASGRSREVERYVFLLP